MDYIIICIQLLLVPMLSPLVVGWIRKVKALCQNRRGASVFQPYADLWKLFQKTEVVSVDASFISLATPYIVFSTTLLVGAIIPTIVGPMFLGGIGDVLVVLSLFMLSTFFLALGGLDAGNAFGGSGSSREMTIAPFSEVTLLCALLPIAFLAGSTNLTTMATAVGVSGADTIFVFLLATVAFFIALLAENSRYPFDNPSTHLELTMVHEAMLIESSGKSLGLLEWAGANKLAVFLVLFANIFFPWDILHPATFVQLFIATAMLIGKVMLGATIVALVESTIPKLRYFMLPELLFTATTLGIIAMVIAII